LDLGDLEVGVDRMADLHELPLGAKGIDTGAERAKSHGMKKVPATKSG
jgi:hypothetical protein